MLAEVAFAGGFLAWFGGLAGAFFGGLGHGARHVGRGFADDAGADGLGGSGRGGDSFDHFRGRAAAVSRGYGRAAEDWLRQRSVPKVQLMVRGDNAGAAGFYEALGYERNDVRVLSRRL